MSLKKFYVRVLAKLLAIGKYESGSAAYGKII